jgi:hypothetical protein
MALFLMKRDDMMVSCVIIGTMVDTRWLIPENGISFSISFVLRHGSQVFTSLGILTDDPNIDRDRKISPIPVYDVLHQ